MNLKKRAAGAIAVAMSVVVMTSVAQAAPADYKTGVASQATTTDLATNGIAGIAVSMSQYESDAYEYIELADANVEQMNVARVTSGDAAEQDAEGMQTMRNLARNLAWMIKCFDAGKAAGVALPDTERGNQTNFIR